MDYINEAKRLRPLIEKAVQSLPKKEALEAKTLHSKWSDLVKKGKVNTDGKPGLRFWYEGDNELYSCVHGDPQFQSDWIPGKGTGALYVRVDEDHAGTVDDPIPAARGMEYVYGLHYLDPEDGKTYLCTRAGEKDGDTVVLQYLPHELVLSYFLEV